MVKVWIYAAILIIISIIIMVRRQNILGIVLWLLYSVIGVFSVVCVQRGMFAMFLDTSIVPYIYLILTYSISFFPFVHNKELQSSKLKIEIPLQYYIFAVLYIFMALVTIRLYLPRVRELISSGKWFKNIEDMYEGRIVFPYSNRVEYLCVQIVSYTRLLALILGFSMLREGKSFAHGLLLIGSAVSTALLTALNISSRGLVLNCFMLAFAFFLYFRKQYDRKIRIFAWIALALGTITMIPVMSDITISRFTKNEASAALFRYFGQPPIVFSGGVSGITQYGYGVNGFGTFFNQRISQSDIGGSWGTGFYTFVGWIFLDWGPLGTIIVVSIISWLLWKIMSKPEHEFSDLFLIFFVYYTLLQGVFVIGRSYCYQIIMAIVVYVFLKVFSDNREYYFGIYGDELNIPKTKAKSKTCKYFK